MDSKLDVGYVCERCEKKTLMLVPLDSYSSGKVFKVCMRCFADMLSPELVVSSHNTVRPT
jgi:hypothetical protein